MLSSGVKTQGWLSLVSIQTVVKTQADRVGMGKYMIKIQRDRQESKLGNYNNRLETRRKQSEKHPRN